MLQNKQALAIIAYHEDEYDVGNVFDTRLRYYGGTGTPLAVFDGVIQRAGGLLSGSMYDQYVRPYDQSAAVPLDMDLSLSLVSDGQVRVEVSNISSKLLSGKLHIAVVERYRPVVWMDMQTMDFICRSMLPGVEGQEMTVNPGETIESTQAFSVQPDWNYCWIVAFFQASDRRILQGAMIPVESTIPVIRISGPEQGSMWLPGSTHSISWTSDRPIEPDPQGSIDVIEVDFSSNGGQSWTPIQIGKSGTGQFDWTLPQITSSRCLLAAFDVYGTARTVSSQFTIAAKGDFSVDGTIDSADRRLLVDYLLENRARVLPGADLNEDGVFDVLDVVYFDSSILKGGAATPQGVRRRSR